MTEPAKDEKAVFVIRLRGGVADGLFRLALGRVPPRLVFDRESDGRRQGYEYAGPEDQVEHTTRFDKASGRNVRESRVAAVYHIFRPAPAAA